MSKREPKWDIDKLRGDEGEQLVRQMRSAVLAGTCEVKTDTRALDTGNVYIEYQCKTAIGWQPSGIATTKASSWAFVLGRTVVWMPTWALKNVARAHGRKQECAHGSHPTKGVLIPVADLLPLSIAQYVTQDPEREAA